MSSDFQSVVLVPSALLLATLGTLSGQAQSAQPPANYRGPDTFGMCAYVAGDTTFYGSTFQTSSYFKAQAQQAIQQYAQAHANGGAVKGARCYWSYKETDLATTKETDKRLLGLPGHSVKGVETGWRFQPGATAAAASPTSAGTATNRYGSTATNATAATSNTANTAVATRTAANRGYPTTANRTAGNGVMSTATPAATTATSTSGTTSSTGTMSSVTGGAQQQLSDAKTSAVGSAAAGVTSITTSAVGGATSAMQGLGSRMFHGKSSQAPTPAPSTATPPANALVGAAPASVAAPQEVASNAPGLGLGVAAEAPVPAGGTPNAGQMPVEGLVADVAGNDLIINVGQGAGIAPGMRLVIMHPQRVVKDPATGKVLRSVESQVGEFKVTSADAGSASGTFTGTGTPIVGDKVRSAPK